MIVKYLGCTVMAWEKLHSHFNFFHVFVHVGLRMGRNMATYHTSIVYFKYINLYYLYTYYHYQLMNTITITESYNKLKTKPEQCIATAN